MPFLQPLINLHRRQAEHVNTKSLLGNSQTQVLTTLRAAWSKQRATWQTLVAKAVLNKSGLGAEGTSRSNLVFEQALLDALPMCPVPEQFSTFLALEVLVEPAQGPRRNAVLDLFFWDLGQFAAAGHTTRLEERQLQLELAQYMCQLLHHLQRWRDPNGRDDPIPQQSSLHQNA